jgi:SAM-dependent methyltransferase
MKAESPHLVELAIARAGDDPRHVMPVLPRGCRRILDVGCGAGQTLMTCDLGPGIYSCGVDVDLAALRLGRQLTARIAFVCAPGEDLPFASNCFDFVISRVALPYMDIPGALAEIHRVLKPNGTLWVALHPYAMARRELIRSVRALSVKGTLFRLYVLLNGFALHVFGTVFRYPFGRWRRESFQTGGGVRRALHAAGYDQIEIVIGRFFVATARKRPARETR